LWITLEYLPPYCPHLNIIERLWKRLKKRLRNIYFPTFNWFCLYILSLLWEIENSFEQLQSTLKLNFGII
jgi:transposase